MRIPPLCSRRSALDYRESRRGRRAFAAWSASRSRKALARPHPGSGSRYWLVSADQVRKRTYYFLSKREGRFEMAGSSFSKWFVVPIYPRQHRFLDRTSTGLTKKSPSLSSRPSSSLRKKARLSLVMSESRSSRTRMHGASERARSKMRLRPYSSPP